MSDFKGMEKLNLGYSLKNIPIPSQRSYKLKLMEKTEMVIKRMRWKAIFCDSEESVPKNTYGLKTLKTPSQVKELLAFENDLLNMVKNVKFEEGYRRTPFQEKLRKDIGTITKSKKTMTKADKTSNMYRLTKAEHDKLVNDAVTSTYKKAPEGIKMEINKEGVKIAKEEGVLDKMMVNGTGNCFVTVKDHKENFQNRPTVRLINPAKNEIGRISKNVLDEINCKLKASLGVNQWKDKMEVINWFKEIPNKNQQKFVVFDIENFYPSISEDLLKKAINFASKRVGVSTKEKEIIFQARKSLLFNKEQPWMKKVGGTFDVTMGAYDGAEVCELIGSFILHQLASKYEGKNNGLYRDDGLAVFENVSGPESERIKKDFQKVFRRNGLGITIKCNKKIVDYLDVTFNLNDGTYRPYKKPNDEATYVHKESNHPPNVIKKLPSMIEKRISDLSATKEIFDNAKGYYEEALQKSGYDATLQFTTREPQGRRKNRQRNIIWYNPPFSKDVKTKVAEEFLKLIDRHFPQRHKYRKIFNRNNVKVSYSSMPNMNSIISGHNKKVTKEESNEIERKCNCRNREQCPLDGHCLTPEVLYQGTVNSNLPRYQPKIYKGITERPAKERIKEHKKSFGNLRYRGESELSKEIWRIKDLGGTPEVSWEILRRTKTYNPKTKRCALCLHEKLAIAEHEGNDMLNKRSEAVAKCMHQNKYALSKLDETGDGS